MVSVWITIGNVGGFGILAICLTSSSVTEPVLSFTTPVIVPWSSWP